MSWDLMLRILAGVVGVAFFLVLIVGYLAGRSEPIEQVRDGWLIRDQHPVETFELAFRAALWFAAACGSLVLMVFCLLVAALGFT